MISEGSSLQSKAWFFTSLVLDKSLHTVSDKFHAQSEKQAARKVTVKS
jgi:hypothetical protein